MSKRLTDSSKWNHKWFRQLLPEYKLLWLYICDNCDAAGVWEIDIDAANFVINSENNKVTLNLLLDYFKDNVILLQLYSKNYLLLTSFIKFQYKGELNENFRPHIPVFQSIKKYQLYREEDNKFNSKLTVSLEQDYSKNTVSLKLQDMDKDKDKDKDNILFNNNINNNKNKDSYIKIDNNINTLSENKTKQEENLIIKHEKKIKEKIDFKIDDIIDENWKSLFILWLEYKKEKKQSYKSPTSTEYCYKNLIKISENNLDFAKEIVEHSIANNYSGLVIPNNQQQKRTSVIKSKSDNYKELLGMDINEEIKKQQQNEQITN